jgi:NTP pyrophosphatase (non-canonical NTP hydrolase)
MIHVYVILFHPLRAEHLCLYKMNQFKYDTYNICRSKGWDKASIPTVWLLFTEEVGELASAIRQHQKSYKKTNLKKERGVDILMEMGDVFSYLFQLAYMLNVDMDEMWIRHLDKVRTKMYVSSNE